MLRPFPSGVINIQTKLRQTLNSKRINELKHRVLQQAVTSNDPALHYQAGLLYIEPETSTPNLEKASVWFSHAAKGGNAHAKLQLAQLYITSSNPEELKQAHELLLQAAADGLNEAENNLGVMYEFGIGIDRNLKQAHEWYQRAAGSGVAQSQYNLALMHLDVDYPCHDLYLGVYWLRAAAAQSHRKAQLTLAQMYERGDCLAQDVLKSEKLHIAVAKNADAQAQLQLAIRYCRGTGVPLDSRKAVKWLERAAKHGSCRMSDLALLCLLDKNLSNNRLRNISQPSGEQRPAARSVDQLLNRSKYYV